MFRQAGNHCQHLVAASLSLDTDFPSIGKFWLCCLDFHQLSFKRKAKKKTLVSRNAGDKKNLHLGSHQLCSFGILVGFVFACLFLEIKNIYSDTHSTMQVGEWFHLLNFRKQYYFFRLKRRCPLSSQN